MLDNLRDLLISHTLELIMSIKFASYAAFDAAEKQVAHEMQAFRQLYETVAAKERSSKREKSSTSPAKHTVGHKKGSHTR